MHGKFTFRKKLLARLVVGSLIMTGGQAAFAATIDVGTVQSNAGSTGGSTSYGKNSAPYQAPTQGSLLSTEPQSIISQQYIQQNAAAGANYTDIVNVAPSIASIDPNGPGMMETQSMTMRGFADGQFNVTFDGIPWGDSNDFTHHSTSYYMAQDIGNIVIDRGPGDASNIGDATFGGTIAVHSKNPTSEAAFTPYATFGSFNTRLFGVEFNSGTMQSYGDASAVIDYKNFSTDGYLTNSSQRRGNLFVKFVKPVGDNTVLTFVTMQNKLHQNVPLGTTLANIALYGKNYGLNNNPNSQNFYGYNYDNITGDMEYAGIQTRQGDWTIDNKLYTYAYYHNGYNGADTGGAQANGTTYGANNVPGQEMYMNYRSWGDILHVSKAMGPGNIDFGAWIDHQTNGRAQWNVDYTLGGALDPAGATGGYSRLMNDTLTTIQPYVQYEWKVTDALTLTPGLKYTSFKRTDDSPINQGTKAPLHASQTWSKALPALTAHYEIQPNWTAYAQFAQGFLAPNLNTFYQTGAVLSTVKPTETTNYQIGTTWKDKKLTVSGDVYKITSTNWMSPVAQGNQTVFQNAGDVDFSGLEGEATYYVGEGVSLYGNYALINYTVKNIASGMWPLQNVPRNTAAAGVMYNQGPIYASLIAKQIGTRYSNVDVNGNPIYFNAFTVANFNASYSLKDIGSWAKNAKIGLQVNNLFNNTDLYASIVSDANGNPMYYAVPERNFELSLSLSM